MPGLRLSRRERRTVVAGAVISVASLTLVFGLLPLERRWSLREDRIAAAADRLARLRYLVAHENDLRREVGMREGVSSSEGARILVGRTPAIAASALQSAIREYAARSSVTVNRLDVAGEPDTATSVLPMLPASISAVGDIYGITEFLSLLQRGSPVIEIRDLTIVSNSALREGLLQISLTLRAPSAGG